MGGGRSRVPNSRSPMHLEAGLHRPTTCLLFESIVIERAAAARSSCVWDVVSVPLRL